VSKGQYSNKILASVLILGAGLGVAKSSYALISVAELNARNAKKASAPKKSHFRVVLDPGHGGIDKGTSYEQLYEKDVTLALAKEVASQLRSRGIEVVITRDIDREIPLSQRTAMANKLGADVFISLHMNSLPRGGTELASGTETYILNNANDGSSKRLAELENTVMAGEPGPNPNVQDAQPMDVALILKDLRLDANLPESKRLACMLQSQMVLARGRATGNTESAPKTDRGVRQALFFVLLGADMPSALVEAGFLSNPKDRAWLTSKSGQKGFGLAIARAINLFRLQKNTLEARKTLNTCKVH
jgi:N-acetylmuramoyl-L-alanine amidase